MIELGSGKVNKSQLNVFKFDVDEELRFHDEFIA